MTHSPSVLSVLVLAAALAAQDPKERESPPDPLHAAWLQALDRAKLQKAPILAFVLPPADAKADAERVAAMWRREGGAGMSRHALEEAPPPLSARALLLRHIQLLRLPEFRGGRNDHEVKPTPSLAILALSIPVVAAAERCGAKAGETVVLLGQDGKRQQGFAIDLLDAEAFAKQVGALLFDPAALAARAANVPADLGRDVAALPATPQLFLEDHALEERLRAHLAAAAPLLVKVADNKLELHPALWLLDELRPPLGTEKPGLPDMCTGCGMGFTPQAFANVLQLIGP